MSKEDTVKSSKSRGIAFIKSSMTFMTGTKGMHVSHSSFFFVCIVVMNDICIGSWSKYIFFMLHIFIKR